MQAAVEVASAVVEVGQGVNDDAAEAQGHSKCSPKKRKPMRRQGADALNDQVNHR